MLGVHAPEFTFGRSRGQVEAAVGRLGIRWPVVLDNDYLIWQAFANHSWPSLYLIDPRGYIRYRQIGEGAYPRTERAIQALLSELDPTLSFPEPLPPVRAEDAPGAICLPTTHELHVDALGDAGPVSNIPTLFTPAEQRSEGHFYLEGIWRVTDEGVTLAGGRGAIYLPYHAASVNAILSPSPDPVEVALNLREPMEVQLKQDNQPLPKEHFAEDVFLADGQARVRVDVPRLYALVKNPDVRMRELRLEVRAMGVTLYAFSFGSCLISEAAAPGYPTE